MTSDPGTPEKYSPDRKLVAWPTYRWALEENSDRDLIEHSRDLLCLHDLQGRLLSVNPVPRLLGYSVEEILQIPMRDLVDPKFRDQFDVYLREIERVGEVQGVMAVMTRAGERRFWEYHNTLRTSGVEAPVVRGMAHDVTERVYAEEALRKTNKKLLDTAREQESTLSALQLFRTLLDQSNDAILVTDPETLRFLDSNERAWTELGYSREELLSMTAFDIDPDIGSVRTRVDQQLRQKGCAIIERAHRRKDGTTFPVELNLHRVRLDREYDVAVSRDITERKRAEEALRETNERLRKTACEQELTLRELKLFRALLDQSNDAIEVVDPETLRFLDVNERACVELGYSREELLSMTVFDIDPNINEDWRAWMRQQMQESEFAILERVHRRKDGTTFPVEVNTQKVRLDRDYRVGMVRDITARKQAEEALRESEQRLRLAQEIAQAGTFERNFLTGENRWTPEMEAMHGLPPGGFPRTMEQFLELVHPDDRQHVSDLLVPSEQIQPTQGEWRVIWPDGTVHWIAGRWRILKDPQGRPCRLLGMDLDVTKRKQAETALRQSEERLRLAQEAAQIGTFERNLRTGETRWTPQMEALYGLPPGDFPKTIDKFLELIHVDDRKQVKHWIDHSFEFGEAKGEWRVIWPDGTLRWISGRWRVFKDSTGKPERAIGMDFDITERKQVEEALRQATERLTEEKLYLEHEIDTELGFEDIIGQSKALKAVMESVGKVATTDAAVLLLGETGTGKELIARAIHRLSRRAGNSFIKMNCAAIPSGLLESELFGNERGAFTGAVSRKIGRLELADKGTIFLDEIGEISLALQPKLLRVLQDQEFERLGGTQTLKVNFRLIAATNRDLAESVRENEFRGDLYYRLNVFPIRLPPLRDRRDDIPLLVERFVQKCSRRMNKSITSVPTKTMDALVGWNWPGNVRELENFIERSVILTTGSVLAAPLNELQPMASIREEDETLKAKEREHILRALQESHGQISGPRGAAIRLGLKRTTLQSKLKHLGINPRIPPQGSP